MRDVFITGAAGLQGSALFQRLVEEGYPVKGIDNYSRGSFKAPYIFGIDGRDVSAGFFADDVVIFHLAADVAGVAEAHKRHWEMLHHNLELDGNILQVALEANASRIIYPSSACMYPVNAQTEWNSILTEEMAFGNVQPESGYGWSKLMGEIQLRYYPLPWVVLRLFNVYGEGENNQPGSHVIPELMRKVMAAPDGGAIQVYGDGTQGRAFLHADDAVEAYIKAMDCESGHVMNIGYPEPIRIRDLVGKIIKLSGKNLKVEYTGENTGVIGRTPDITRAKDIMGWEPEISLDDGLRRCWEHYSGN